jgi:hypothetical protein
MVLVQQNSYVHHRKGRENRALFGAVNNYFSAVGHRTDRPQDPKPHAIPPISNWLLSFSE